MDRTLLGPVVVSPVMDCGLGGSVLMVGSSVSLLMDGMREGGRLGEEIGWYVGTSVGDVVEGGMLEEA